ncbi:MAG TPA: peptidoglycan editing factor PgeF [Spirochaetota bacterium]|nr:peptidoglycan editing factor PgeF [Spirochaetota bacterium]
MFLKNNTLKPEWSRDCKNLICGFTLPYFGNQALTRKSYSTGKTLKENRIFLAENLGIDSGSIFSPRQTHSDIVVFVDDENSGRGSYSIEDAVEGDACLTDKNNNLLLVTWADCIPAILFEKEKNIVAAIHSGWRGTKENITGKTVEKMVELGGDPENIFAAIGPGIRDCCYQIGSEVAEYFKNKEYCEYLKIKDGEYRLDLQSVIYKQLLLSGIKKENIDNAEKCNCCDKEINFFSCRKDGKENFEAQAAFIGVYPLPRDSRRL